MNSAPSGLTPFYIKYLKSYLPARDKCIMYNPNIKEIFEADSDVEAPYFERMREYKDSYRVDLFVCSRDRSIICPWYYSTHDKEWYTLNTINRVYTSEELIEAEDYLPVIGMVSPNVYWLNQGDELSFKDVEPAIRWFIKTNGGWEMKEKVRHYHIDDIIVQHEQSCISIRAVAVKHPKSLKFC